MVIQSKTERIPCFVCQERVRVAIFDKTMAALVCTECLPFCIGAGRELVKAGIPCSAAETVPET